MAHKHAVQHTRMQGNYKGQWKDDACMHACMHAYNNSIICPSRSTCYCMHNSLHVVEF